MHLFRLTAASCKPLATNKMIQQFISYINEQLNSQSCIYAIHENTDYVHSMYVDIDNDTNLGRVTLWDDNSCVMEILHIETGNYLFSKRYEFTSFSELVEKFSNFYAMVSQTASHSKLTMVANKQQTD